MEPIQSRIKMMITNQFNQILIKVNVDFNTGNCSLLESRSCDCNGIKPPKEL